MSTLLLQALSFGYDRSGNEAENLLNLEGDIDADGVVDADEVVAVGIDDIVEVFLKADSTGSIGNLLTKGLNHLATSLDDGAVGLLFEGDATLHEFLKLFLAFVADDVGEARLTIDELGVTLDEIFLGVTDFGLALGAEFLNLSLHGGILRQGDNNLTEVEVAKTRLRRSTQRNHRKKEKGKSFHWIES